MDPENMDQKSEDKICEMEAMNEIKEAEIKRQSTNEELDREMKSNISNVCESKESVNDNYEESENISYQLINLESEVEKSSFPENSTTDQNEKSGKCSEDTNCMKSGLEAKDKQTGISILNTSLVESTNSAEFLQSVDSQSSTIKISEEASFQMNRAPDHFEDREEPNKTDDLTKLQTIKTTHPEMMKLDEQNVIECHTSEDVDNDKLKVDTGRKDIDDDKLKVETGSKDNDNDKLEVETGSKDNDNDKLEVETGIEDTDSDKLKVDTGSEALNSDKLEVDSEDIDKGNDKMKVDTASENIDKDNDKLKVDTGSEDLDNDKLKVETGSEDKGDEELEEINKGEKHSQDEIMDQPNFASNQSEKTPIRRITPKPTISDQIDAFNRCFGSTDSDSDCDKLVLDYKTQGSESCTSGAETDVDLHGNKTTKPMMYSKSELMKDTLIPPVCNETETEDNQRSQKEELKNRMMDEKDESVRNNLMQDGMSRDSTIDTDESVSTEQSVYPNFKPIIDVQSPPRTSKDDELKGTSGNDLAQISKDLEMEDQKMSYLNDGKTFSDELKPEKISMAVDGDENQVSLNLKSEDTLAGSGLSTNTPNRPDSRPETEMETQSIPEFSPTLNIIAGVQITPEEFEKIETENDLSFSSKNESYEDGSISESEIQSVAVKISEPAPILASILDKQVPKVSSTVSEKVNAPETNATKLTGMITKIKTEPVDEGYPSASSFNVSKINVAGNGKPTPIPLAIQSSSLMPYSSSSSSLSSSSTVTPRFSLSENSNLVSRLKVKKVTNTAQIAGPRIIRVPNPRPPYQELNIQPKRQENGNVGRKPTPRYGGTKIVRITQATANKQLGPKVKKNFDSFDIASVTDILQRKHKIGNHKAPPILMRYKDYLKDFTVSSCLECGDSFTSREMLSFHRNRVSVEISYKCPLCMNVVIFYNKCSFLNHIRIHNTERAQSKNPAIQVKADILSIRLAPYKMILETLEKPIPTIEISDKPRPRPPQNLGSCTECGKVCDTNLSLAEHFGSGEVICSFAHVCNMCNMIFPRQCALEAHKRYHSNQMPYTCPECGLVVGEINEFRKHLHTKCFHFTRAGLLRCFRNLWKPCGHTDIRLNSFIKHLHTHHATKMNECAVTKSPSGEEKTVTTTIVACGICNTVLRNPVKMKEHMNIHVKEVKRNATFVYVCTNCPVSSCGLNLSMYTSKKDLEDHYRSKHREYFKMPPNVRSLICSACSTVTGSYSKFLEHQLQAHEMINAEFYFCQQCKCMFENPDILSIHTCHPKVFTIAKHSENYGEPQKLCEIAPKPAVNSPPRISLKSPPKPMNKSPPKPVSKVQPKKLVQLQPKPPAKVPNLVIKLVPKAPEKHECLFCHKEFKNKDEKEKHSQSEHSSFPCHLCGLTYKTQLNLDEHVQATHEGSKPGFFCLPCKKKGITRTFVKAGVLEKHLIFKHRIAKARLKRFIAVGKESSKSDKLKRKTPDELESVPVKRLRVEGSGVYTCVKCNFNTEDSSEFSAHIETHKTTDTTQCPECGLCFSVLPSLKKHLFMVHKIRNADEYISEKGIEEPEEMDVDDEEDDLLEVTISPRKTPFTDIAPSEPIRKKNGPIGELECRVCYREFESVNLLKNHMRVHGMAFIRSRRLTPSESDGCKTDKEEQSP